MTTAAKVLNIAASQLGYKETPANSNRTKFGAWYGQDGEPWCAMFVSWCLSQAGMPLHITKPTGFAYCPYGVDWFKKQGLWHTSNPQPGDVVFFDWYPGTSNSGAWHVGFVESVNADGTVTCIEGNTSYSNQDNGGVVMRRKRSKSLIMGYGRPKYTAEAQEPESDLAPCKIHILLPGGVEKTVDGVLIGHLAHVHVSKVAEAKWDGPNKTATLDLRKL